uniref:EF-hand domain-containing protein n=1 Tax=Ananas comosus var. bracteatus TaxID=296719 RepID=A0A6V7NV64_ANACO|nr:unnamed protein product [Ananas comosus var. bracteatus]
MARRSKPYLNLLLSTTTTTTTTTLLLLLLLFVLSSARSAHARPISLDDPSISDGADPAESLRRPQTPLLLRLNRLGGGGGEEGCEQTYGFLPCTTTAMGNLFLSATYGFLMYKAATYLSSGSEMLLEILGPGIVGGLFLPILGALPDAMLILVSGLSGSKETAQSQVLIGMGLLAGSTVMLLTILWGSCIVVGKCDLSENSTSVDSQDTKGFSLFGSGVSTDTQTMVLLALIVSVLLVLSYCLYQVFQPWIQRRKLAYAKHKHVISGILRHAQMESLGRLLYDDGTPNVSVIKKLYRKLDLDSDGVISRAELAALIVGIQFEEIDLDRDDAVDKIMDDFDTSGNAIIEEEEFIQGITKWLKEARRTVPASGAYSKKFLHDFHTQTKDEHNKLIEMSDEAAESVENPTWTCVQAVLLLLLGTVMAAMFADPLVDAVHNFSNATKIPSFFISFIAMPLATNSSEAVSAIIFASRKKQRTSSLTFSEIYGGVTMNNTLCLAVFLALVYLRHLTWDFSSEVLIILIVCLVMGLFTSFRTTFPLWTCFIAFLLYPLSLVIVYVLDFIFGWS